MKIDTSKEANWKTKTQLAFVLFAMLSATFIFSVIKEMKKPEFDVNNLLTVGIVWLLTLILWLGYRWYYRLYKKNNSNKIKEQ